MSSAVSETSTAIAEGPSPTLPSPHLEDEDTKAKPWYKRLKNNRGVLLFLVSGAAMLDIINVASITIALPSIERDAGYDPTQLQWCVSAYALTYAAFLLIGGRMGDLFGHKRIFLLGTAWFALWALICGFARSPIFMSVARALEGAGAGFTIPSALALLTTSYAAGAERNFALSIFSGSAIVGQTVGVLLGGILDATIGWQWIFYLTAIFSAALAGAGYFILSETKAVTITHDSNGQPLETPVIDTRIDYTGAALFTLGIIAVVYYLTESITAGWGSVKTVVPFVVGLISLGLFVVWEWRIDYPIMPFHIWRSRRFSSSILIIICVTATYNTLIFYSSLTFQNVLGFNSLITACCYIVHGVGLMIGLYSATRLFALTRTKVIMTFGFVFIIVSAVIFAQTKPSSTYWQFAFPALIVHCFGCSPTWMCCQVNAVADAKDEDQGVVGAIFNVGVQLGAPLGLAIATIISQVNTTVTSPVQIGLMHGYSAAFYSYGVMGGVGLVVMLIFAANRDPADFAGPVAVDKEGLELEVEKGEAMIETATPALALASATAGGAGDVGMVLGGHKAEMVGTTAGSSLSSSSSSVSLPVGTREGKEEYLG